MITLLLAFISAAMSYAVNGSILWSILHFMIPWIYIPYWLIFKTDFIGYLQMWVTCS